MNFVVAIVLGTMIAVMVIMLSVVVLAIAGTVLGGVMMLAIWWFSIKTMYEYLEGRVKVR